MPRAISRTTRNSRRVRELAYRLGITPGTVARAYTILTDTGVLRGEVGRGTFVNPTGRTARAPEEAGDKVLDDSGGMMNFVGPRLPDVGQVALIRSLLGQVARAPSSDFLTYPTRGDYRGARQAAANWLSDMPLGPLDQEDIVLSHGGQNAILLIMQAVLRGTRPVILVEEQSYAGFRRAAETLRAETVSVPMDEFGAIPEALAEVAQRTGAQMFCATPEVQNPTCRHTPLERRAAIARVAQRHNLEIIEDECYRLGRSQTESYRSICPDRTWYVSSISKVLTPALRVGFAVAPRGRGSELRRAAENGFFGAGLPVGRTGTAVAQRSAHDGSGRRSAPARVRVCHCNGEHTGAVRSELESRCPLRLADPARRMARRPPSAAPPRLKGSVCARPTNSRCAMAGHRMPCGLR